MPGRIFRTIVHIIRAATYGGQGMETDRMGAGLRAEAKATDNAPDPNRHHATPDPTFRYSANCASPVPSPPTANTTIGTSMTFSW